MKTYHITIQETKQFIVTMTAESEQEAINKVKQNYEDGLLINIQREITDTQFYEA
jgi:flagellar biosynthesis GTPase FlhF